MSVRISGIEEIEMTSSIETQTLLIVDCDSDAIDLYMALNVSLEYLTVTIDGED